VTVPDTPAISRKGHIDGFALQAGAFVALEDRRIQLFQGRFDFYFDFVGNAAEFRALFLRKLAEILKFESEKT
jgi:hypothetical protein